MIRYAPPLDDEPTAEELEFMPSGYLPDAEPTDASHAEECALPVEHCTVEIHGPTGLDAVRIFPNRTTANAWIFQFNHEHPDGAKVAAIHNKPAPMPAAAGPSPEA